jgi:hypothetical protein
LTRLLENIKLMTYQLYVWSASTCSLELAMFQFSLEVASFNIFLYSGELNTPDLSLILVAAA